MVFGQQSLKLPAINGKSVNTAACQLTAASVAVKHTDAPDRAGVSAHSVVLSVAYHNALAFVGYAKKG